MEFTAKNAKQVVKILAQIAEAYALVYENGYIASDMQIYSDRYLAYEQTMKEVGKFAFSENLYIRTRGVETRRQRVDDFHDRTVAIVTVEYDKKTYTVRKENELL